MIHGKNPFFLKNAKLWYAVFRDIVKDAVSALDCLLPDRWADPRSLDLTLKSLMRGELKSVRIWTLTLFELILTAQICRLGNAVWALPFWHLFCYVSSDGRSDSTESKVFVYDSVFSWYIHEIIPKLISRFYRLLLCTGSFDMDLWSRFPLLMPIDKTFQVYELNGILVAFLNY